jgi:hypothetical protein
MRLTSFFLLSTLCGVIASACVYDPDDRCGPHQLEIDNDQCVCETGFVPGDAGCVPCAENEEERAGACICADGFARPTDAEACAPIPEALGAACDVEADPCADEPYPLCHATDGTSGYCTSSCSSDGDCTGGYKCHVEGNEGFCRRPPLGHGATCASDADCEGGDATFCETLSSKQCLVPCQAGDTDVCFEGEACCDFLVFAPICVPADVCAEMGNPVQ